MRLNRDNTLQAAGKIVAVLDIGSSKICCLIAAVSPDEAGTASGSATDRRVVALGFGHQRSRGILAGTLSDPAAAIGAVRAAVSQAEQMAQTELESIYLGVACGRPRSRVFQGHVELPSGVVEASHIEAIASGARTFAGRDGGVVLALNRLGYRLDGHATVREPGGMAGRQLHADHHAVLVEEGPLRNMTLLAENCHLDVAGTIPAALASALATTSEQDRWRGVTCVDIGAGHTSIASFVQGQLIHIGQISAGGQQMTDDIARALSVPLAEAERIKTLYAMLVPTLPVDETYSGLPFPGAAGEGPDGAARARVAEIVRYHAAGLVSRVVAEMEHCGVARLAGERMVLTGGGSQVPGLGDFASSVVGRAVSVAGPMRVRGWGAGVPSAAFSCVVGLAVAAALPDLWGGGQSSFEAVPQGYLGRMERWLRDNF